MARECTWCKVKWPYSDDFIRCPRCQENTTPRRANPDMSDSDAAAMKAEAEFGWYLVTQWLAAPS